MTLILRIRDWWRGFSDADLDGLYEKENWCATHPQPYPLPDNWMLTERERKAWSWVINS